MNTTVHTYNDLLARIDVLSETEQALLKRTLESAQLSREMPVLERMEWDQDLSDAEFLLQTTQIATWFRDDVRPLYKKQLAFFKAGALYDERAIFGGNRTGKTQAGVYEDTLHLTGLYPAWWEGYRFDHPVDMWVATDTAKNTREILQEKFCGKPGVPNALGTGMIPLDLFAREPTIKHGTPNAYETIYVYHHTNGAVDGVSTGMFKSYDQGREAFQGTHQDLIHLDEEPKLEIYSECSLRLMSTSPGQPNGKLILTETPLLGISELLQSFMPELKPEPDAAPISEYAHVDVDADGNEIVIDE
jgi:phage terminase large subunit-like protein